VWLVLHIALAIGVIVFCVMHDVGSILFIALWWVIDLTVRYVVMAGCRYPTKATIRKIDPDVCELRFEKPPGFHYNAGQFVQIAVRDISAFQFHPISISSAPHEDYVTLHIRALGGWSGKLVELAEKQHAGRSGANDLREVSIFLEGPYGSLTVDLDDHKRYKHVLLVCGGIGVTHCQSVGKALQYQAHEEGRKLNSMRLIWAVRDLNMVRDMPPLQDDMIQSDESNDDINHDDICKNISKEVYCTRAGQPDSEDPLPSDVILRTHRPDLDQIFSEMKQEAIDNGEVNIAVFGCGPNALMDTLKECCRKHSQSVASCGGVFFDLHMEHFEF
jgi:NADPH oxidase